MCAVESGYNRWCGYLVIGYALSTVYLWSHAKSNAANQQWTEKNGSDFTKQQANLLANVGVHYNMYLLWLVAYIFSALDRTPGRYSKPQTAGQLQALRRKFHVTLTNAQLATMKALLEWRDQMARKLDESPGWVPDKTYAMCLNELTHSLRFDSYVLPNITLLQLARNLPLDSTRLKGTTCALCCE